MTSLVITRRHAVVLLPESWRRKTDRLNILCGGVRERERANIIPKVRPLPPPFPPPPSPHTQHHNLSISLTLSFHSLVLHLFLSHSLFLILFPILYFSFSLLHSLFLILFFSISLFSLFFIILSFSFSHSLFSCSLSKFLFFHFFIITLSPCHFSFILFFSLG